MTAYSMNAKVRALPVTAVTAAVATPPVPATPPAPAPASAVFPLERFAKGAPGTLRSLLDAISRGVTLHLTSGGRVVARVIPVTPSPNPMMAPARALAEPIAARHHCTVEQMFGRSRLKRPSAARRELWRELRRRGLTFEEIGRLFDRDHSTIVMGTQVPETSTPNLA